MNASDNNEPGDQLVCFRCVREPYLANIIDRDQKSGVCSYCSFEGSTITIADLSVHVKVAFNQYFQRTVSEPEGYEYEMAKEGNWERAGEPVTGVIAELLNVDEEIAEHVREVLDEETSDRDSVMCGEEQPFSSDAHYEELASIDHESLSRDYRRFETMTIEQTRYFSPEARRLLHTLFGQLDGMQTHDGRNVLVDAGLEGRNSEFFRARVFQNDDELKKALKRPDGELGPTPPRSGSAGRLNAAGISLFYGADAPEVALAEVRPPVGSRVVIARFVLVRPIRLLDIDALKSLLVAGSLFDPTHFERLKRAAFLNNFSERFTRPVMPNREAFEYIPTQVVADYLANEVIPHLDGILYASSQTKAGRNVALFHRSSRVEQLVMPEGMHTDVELVLMTEDGPEPGYTVWEEIPASKPKPISNRTKPVRRRAHSSSPDSDARGPTLRIDLDSLEVRHIEEVQVRSTTFNVDRHRFEASSQKSSTYDF